MDAVNVPAREEWDRGEGGVHDVDKEHFAETFREGGDGDIVMESGSQKDGETGARASVHGLGQELARLREVRRPFGGEASVSGSDADAGAECLAEGWGDRSEEVFDEFGDHVLDASHDACDELFINRCAGYF